MRPTDRRHDFGDEFAHFAWEIDLGISKPSTLAVPMYAYPHRPKGKKKQGRIMEVGRLVEGAESQ